MRSIQPTVSPDLARGNPEGRVRELELADGVHAAVAGAEREEAEVAGAHALDEGELLGHGEPVSFFWGTNKRPSPLNFQ